jgi:hypothetical protein
MVKILRNIKLLLRKQIYEVAKGEKLMKKPNQAPRGMARTK